ncbi:MAG: HPF/RaiA family ribosome-associated protein [Gammaproteobacteria bacterium]|jgi:ribosomal subunit interface protein
MKLPLEINFRNLAPSEAIETAIRKRAAKLDRFYEDIMRCRVTIEAPHRHQHKGKLYSVKIDVTVPNDELVVSRAPDRDHSHEDVYVAIRDAFDAMTRRIEDYVRVRRGQTKTHETPPHGRVSEIYPMLDYGRIATPDGRDIYFHRNSLLNAGFDDLAVGDEVRFSEEPGDQGPKATSVQRVGKHHLVG